MMPHLQQKSSKALDVKTLAPSVVMVTGMPNVVMNWRRAVIQFSVVSLLNFRIVNQLEYRSTRAR